MKRRSFLKAGAATFGSLIVPGSLLAAYTSTKDAFAAALEEHPWLIGYKGAVQESYHTADVTVTGKLPSALKGVMYRNGPALHEIGNTRYEHFFDGDGMIQAYRIGDGKISHTAKMIQTRKYVLEKEAGRPLFSAFGTPIEEGRAVTGPDSVNVANISVLPHADKLYALWEGGSAYELDPDTLDTIGLKFWSDETGGMPFSAHPRVEADGTIWNTGYAPSNGLLLIWKISPKGKLQKIELVPAVPTPMIHDFLITEKHLVLVMAPYTFDEPGGSFLDSFFWHDDTPTKLLIIDKNDLSKRQIVETDPMFVFHFGNA